MLTAGGCSGAISLLLLLLSFLPALMLLFALTLARVLLLSSFYWIFLFSPGLYLMRVLFVPRVFTPVLLNGF